MFIKPVRGEKGPRYKIGALPRAVWKNRSFQLLDQSLTPSEDFKRTKKMWQLFWWLTQIEGRNHLRGFDANQRMQKLTLHWVTRCILRKDLQYSPWNNSTALVMWWTWGFQIVLQLFNSLPWLGCWSFDTILALFGIWECLLRQWDGLAVWPRCHPAEVQAPFP